MDGRINRVQFLGMPVDAGSQEAVYDSIEQLLLDGQRHQIVLLTVQKLLKAKFDLELNRCIRQAALILPVSKGIIRGARFQGKPTLHRYNPFEFVIRLLALAERLEKSIYLLGARKGELEQAEKNLKISFPNLKVVGRYSGYFDETMEHNIVLAIRKSSPTFVLVGKGIANRDKWIARNQNNINPGIYLCVDNCFEIFAGTEKNVPKKLFRWGLEYLNDFFQKPWKIFAVFPYLYFKLLVLVFKIRGV